VEEYEGTKVTTAQALKWPRTDATDDDGEEYSSSAIPTIILHALYETALDFLAADSDPLADTGLEGFTKAKVGPLEVEMRRDFEAVQLSDYVLELLRPVRVSSGAISGRRWRV
jgi:hypothetical protein